MVSLGFAPTFFSRMAAAQTRKKGRILVAIFQRGAADGLNIVVPFGESGYSGLRPSIAIPAPKPGDENSALDLDGFFGLHPALRPLLDLYRAGHLAAVHAAGSPDHTRSHFDAQDYMETAAPGQRDIRDGWLNRYLTAQPRADATPFRAVSLTPGMPRSLQGTAPALAMNSVAEFSLRVGRYSAAARSDLYPLYADSSDSLLRKTAAETFEALDFLKRLDPQRYQAAPGADYPAGPLGSRLRQIAQLIKSGAGLEIAFAETGGWDHHVNEGGPEGQMAQRLRELAQALAAFYRDMGARMDDIVVLTMSEFGRTARENGTRGTDHGHANVMFALGGPVRGGRVYGDWPGLGPEQLYEGRDLALTTDFRDVFGEIVTSHLGLENPAPVFPGFTLQKEKFRNFLA